MTAHISRAGPALCSFRCALVERTQHLSPVGPPNISRVRPGASCPFFVNPAVLASVHGLMMSDSANPASGIPGWIVEGENGPAQL